MAKRLSRSLASLRARRISAWASPPRSPMSSPRYAVPTAPGSTGKQSSPTAASSDTVQHIGYITMKLTENTILITGGGSGIGRELALRFNDLENEVIVAGRRLQPLQEVISGRQNMYAAELDVTDPQAIDAFARQVVREHPQLNILVNNAGIMRFDNPGAAGDLADAQAQVATNLLGPIRLTNALTEHLKARPNPAVGNVSSGL